jgi:hypothetical protein
MTFAPCDGTSCPGTSADTFVSLGCYKPGSGTQQCAWYVPSGAAATAWNVNITGGTPYYHRVTVIEISKPAGTTLSMTGDGFGPGAGTSSTASASTTGSTSNAADLVLGQTNGSGQDPTGTGTGFTDVDPGGGHEVEMKTVTSTGVQTCTWPYASSNAWQAICGAIAAVGGGPPACTPTLGLMGVGRCG